VLFDGNADIGTVCASSHLYKRTGNERKVLEMALVRFDRRLGWDPIADLLDLTDLYGGRMLDLAKITDGQELVTPTAWHPAVDMFEDNDNIIVKMDLPGLTKDDIDISFDGHVLSITGQRKIEEMKGEGSYWSKERFSGEFHRYIHLPMEVSSENLSAKFREGVLEVTVPKAEKNKVKKIPIESGEAKKE
jgi:HSP20 family protein